MAVLATGKAVRQQARAGHFDGPTAGHAPDHLQGNVVILPSRHAADFLQFCLNNPKPCPLIGVSGPGEIAISALGEDMDIRRDIPKYRIHEQGRFTSEVREISDLWNDEMVTFVLGCSFTFEEALMREGYGVRHIETGRNVPMFRTSIETIAGGIFRGPMVVTMRPFKKQDIPRVYDISSRYPHAHGAPLYWGDPAAIGISDLQKPDYGDAVEIAADEIPVFWACGVTPQAAIAKARPDLSITHAPGCMLVTDVPSDSIPVVSVQMTSFIQSSD